MVPAAAGVEEDREEKTRQRQRRVLVALLEPGASMGSIADGMKVSKSSLQRTYQQLQKLKLIREILDGWKLTPEGKLEATRLKEEGVKVEDDTPF
jgi:Mn-dependent DtxR family transcriptional regulator